MLRLAVCFLVLLAQLSAVEHRQTSLPRDVRYEPNVGQAPAGVHFLAHGQRGAVLLGEGELTTLLRGSDGRESAVRLRMLGSSIPMATEGSERLPGIVNYLRGSDESKWIRDVAAYARVTQKGVYPGVDLVLHGKDGEPEYDFVVAPGTDPSVIRLSVEGIRRMRVDRSGELVLDTPAGELRHRKPVLYQTIEGKRTEVAGRFRSIGRRAFGFEVGEYDRRHPLVIDPTLSFAVTLGGDVAYALTADTSGNVYVGGDASANSPGLPVTPGALRATRNGQEGFVAKLDPAGNIVFATYVGGSGFDRVLSLAVDSDANVYVAGETDSANFPTTTGVINRNVTGMFVTKLHPSGNQIVWSTTVGVGLIRDIEVDPQGQVVIAGNTSATGFPVTQGSLQPVKSSGLDAFLLKLNATASGIVWGTFLGGSGTDYPQHIKLGGDGSVYVTGETNSGNFPVTPGAYQTAHVLGRYDVFVSKINPTGSALAFSSRFGGGQVDDTSRGIGLDSTGSVYITGNSGPGFPSSAGARVPSCPTAGPFITKLNSSGSAQVFSSFLFCYPHALSGSVNLAVSNSGTAYISVPIGFTNLTTFQPTPDALQPGPGDASDSVIMILAADGHNVTYGSWFGGVGMDFTLGIVHTSPNDLVIAGEATNAAFPRTKSLPGAGATGAFVARFSLGPTTSCTYTVSPATLPVANAATTTPVIVTTQAGCPWNTSSPIGWITLSTASGSGTGTIQVSVAANTGAARSATLTIAGHTVQVNQVAGGGSCNYTLAPVSDSAAWQGKTGTTNLSGSCGAWTASSSASWLQAYPITGSAAASIGYRIYPNFTNRARNAVLTVAGRTLNVTQSANTTSAEVRFIQILYFNYLNRLPAPAEIAAWQQQLAARTRAEVALSFLNSEEFNLSGRYIAGLYVGLLRRDAEYSGWQFQRDALVTGGIGQLALAQNFIGSAEFDLQNPGLTNRDFILLLYRQVLLRQGPPAESEVNAWLNVMANPANTRAVVASSFLNSPEFRTGADARITAFLLYATLLFRDGTSAERQNLVNRLQGGTPTAQVLADIVNGAEFASQLN